MPHAASWIRAVNTADYRGFLDYWKNFEFADLHGYSVCVAIGHHAGSGSVARHVEASRIINDEQVGSAFLDELGADACSSSGSDNGFATVESGLQTVANFCRV